MKLNVPVVYQEKNSMDCGLACLSMILSYYGKQFSVEQLRKQIRVYKEGTYVPQLGVFLMKNGFAVEIITLSPFLFNLKDKGLTKEKIKKRIKNFQKVYKAREQQHALSYFLEFFNYGGKISVEIPSIKNIRNEIEQKRPMLVPATTNFLTDFRFRSKPGKGQFNFHFNVITGIDGEFIYVNDPLPDKRGGKKKFKINEYLFGVYASAHGAADNASLMKIKKRK